MHNPREIDLPVCSSKCVCLYRCKDFHIILTEISVEIRYLMWSTLEAVTGKYILGAQEKKGIENVMVHLL